MKLPFLSLKMMVKSGLEFILKLTEPLQSCCCPVQKYLPRLAELAWQLSRYLWRGSVNFKINSRPLFTIIFKLKNDNFMTRDFSPLIEWVLTGVYNNAEITIYSNREMSEQFLKHKQIETNNLDVETNRNKLEKSWSVSFSPSTPSNSCMYFLL